MLEKKSQGIFFNKKDGLQATDAMQLSWDKACNPESKRNDYIQKFKL